MPNLTEDEKDGLKALISKEIRRLATTRSNVANQTEFVAMARKKLNEEEHILLTQQTDAMLSLEAISAMVNAVGPFEEDLYTTFGPFPTQGEGDTRFIEILSELAMRLSYG